MAVRSPRPWVGPATFLSTASLNAVEMSDIESGGAENPFRSDEVAGKDSVLAALCTAAISEGRTHSVWICYKSNGRTLAKDISMRDSKLQGVRKTFRLCSLAREYGWWKQFSIYSAKGVKEVMVIQPEP